MNTLLLVKKYFQTHQKIKTGTVVLLSILSLTPLVSAPLALLMGFIVVEFIGNPFEIHTKKLTTYLLQISVVGLGFGMNVDEALKAGKEGFIFTIISIVSVLSLGFVLTKIFKIEKITGYLISAGTAICGGSAIAAISPLVKAKSNQISVALGVVFILNSVALLVFPFIGHSFGLTQHQFGIWSAIAIHDTSSVVGAASKYGNEALQTATTVKLTRALWIIPLSVLTATFFRNSDQKIKIPWFIFLFIIAICINTYIPQTSLFAALLVKMAKAGLTLTLFLIGLGLSVKTIKSVGAKPLIMAIILWIFISVASLSFIIYYQ